MNEQAVPWVIGYGLLLSAAVGFFWMENWLYSKKDATRHWLYATTLLVLTALVAAFFSWGGSPSRGVFFATLLPLSGCAVGAILGGMFGQFFPENRQDGETSN